MTKTTLFTNNRTQAVRLPKAVAFPPDVREVEIVKRGNSRIIRPVGKGWDDYFLHGARPTDGFMSEREQPPAEDREPL
jgi:antitoxin VapB